MDADGTPARRGSFLATAATFAVGAPAIITLIGAVLWHFGIGRGTGSIGPTDTLEALAWYAVISVFVGWPAMIALAVVMPWLSLRVRTPTMWLAAGAGVTGVFTFLSAMVIGGGGDFSEMIRFAWVFLALGAAAGLACALASDRFRPRVQT